MNPQVQLRTQSCIQALVWSALILLTISPMGHAQPGMSGQSQKEDHSRQIEKSTISLGEGDGKFSAYFAKPRTDEASPAIILIHEWWGLNDWVKKQADRFAEMGYVAIAPDLYRGEVASDAEHAHELMRGLPDERAVADMKAAFEFLAKHDAVKGKPIGIIGWCMGGGLALKLAIAEPRLACTVICYGRPVTEVEQLRKIKGPILGIWGETDRGIDVPPFEKGLKEAGVKATHHIYPGAGHAFLNETNKRGYNAEQAKRAWGEINGFLQKELSAR